MAMYSALDFSQGVPPAVAICIENVKIDLSGQVIDGLPLELSYGARYELTLSVNFRGGLADIFSPALSGDAQFTGAGFGGGASFLVLQRRLTSDSAVTMTFCPKFEPLRYGSGEDAFSFEAVVLNGPNTFVSGRLLEFSCDGVGLSYRQFEAARQFFEQGHGVDKERVATGVLVGKSETDKGLSPEEVWEICTRVSRAFSFAKGSVVALGHVCGYTPNGNEAFRYLGFSKCNQFFVPSGWYDISSSKELTDFVERFVHAQSGVDRKSLIYAEGFYSASNASKQTSAELALIASYSALEVLVYHILRTRGGWSESILSGGRNPFQDKLRTAAKFVRILADPLEMSPRLRERSKRLNDADAFEIIARARNSIVHAEKSFLLDGLELYEAWQVSQWLCEMFVFFLIGYKGMMADRRRYEGWRGEGKGPVPIAW